tara:strand:- start:699 stop:2171 length:1473 start_codon:yes stop_codon:yes gene_type:complete
MGVFDFFKKNKNIENENGLNEVYYNNGKGSLKQRFFQKDGIPNGMSQTFYKDGQLEEQSYWKDGLLHGNLKWYHSNGKLKLESYYIDGNVDYIKYSDDSGWKLRKYEKFKDLEILWNKKPLKLTQLLKFDNDKYFNSFYDLNSEYFKNFDKETLIYFIRIKRKFQIEKYITGIRYTFKDRIIDLLSDFYNRYKRINRSPLLNKPTFSLTLTHLYIKNKILSSDFYGVDISVLKEIKTIYLSEKLIKNKTPLEKLIGNQSKAIFKDVYLKAGRVQQLKEKEKKEKEEEQEKNKKIIENFNQKKKIIDTIFNVIDNNSEEIFGDIPNELKNELADLKKGILPTKKTAKKKENKNRSKKSKYNNSKWWKDKFKEDDCLDYSHYYLRLVRRIFLDPDGTVRLFRADELEISCGDDGSKFFPNLVIGHSKEDKEPHIIENCPAYFIGGVDDSVGTLGEGSLDEIIEILTQIETYDYEDILEGEKNDFYLFTKKKK